LGGVEEQDSAEYLDPVCRKRNYRVNDPVLQFVVILLTAPRNKKEGPRVNQAGETPEASAQRGRQPSMGREGQKRSEVKYRSEIDDGGVR
jgi:hypothetical protein